MKVSYKIFGFNFIFSIFINFLITILCLSEDIDNIFRKFLIIVFILLILIIIKILIYVTIIPVNNYDIFNFNEIITAFVCFSLLFILIIIILVTIYKYFNVKKNDL